VDVFGFLKVAILSRLLRYGNRTRMRDRDLLTDVLPYVDEPEVVDHRIGFAAGYQDRHCFGWFFTM